MSGISFQSFPASSSFALTTKQAITKYTKKCFFYSRNLKKKLKEKQVLICLKPTTNPSNQPSIYPIHLFWCLTLHCAHASLQKHQIIGLELFTKYWLSQGICDEHQPKKPNSFSVSPFLCAFNFLLAYRLTWYSSITCLPCLILCKSVERTRNSP